MKSVRAAALLVLALPLVAFPATAQENGAGQWRARGAFAALFVADVPAMVDWYVSVLDFRVAMSGPTPRSPDVAYAALLERHGSVLELLQQRAPQGQAFTDRPRDPQVMGIIKIGFVVEDLDALEASLAARNIPFNHRSVRSGVGGMRTFAIRDPEGNTVQFFGL